ncbi:histidine kinase [Lyngbya sp. CCY1209]|uniref:histidine kinase n=1 Tax=Lyngbya sp. CCY1209 TaxID=2886103 RepID=UPI002D20CFE9|nr:histidine kinase [Lyngbya sp. CCY1209]MEB3883713.1 histidine kinase [Lyngbya sp. CCY1209]
MQVTSESSVSPEAVLQLLLFVDRRPSSQEQVRQIRQYLDQLEPPDRFELQIIDVGEQPYLAEHFKLVATPALVKIHPDPRHILAGSDIMAQLDDWWPRWVRSLERYQSQQKSNPNASAPAYNSVASINYVAELIRLSDEVFRLKQDKEQLQQQLSFKDRIMEILAHDLRSPLTATSLALETLESAQMTKEGNPRKITPALKSRLIQQARSQIRTIDRMITNILQTATGQSSRLQLQPTQLSLVEFFHEVLAEFHDQLVAKSLQLKTDLPGDTPQVYADRDRIRQVFVNLLDNAIKYTPEGGTIQVSILHRTTQKVQVSICDSGPGIPEENRDRIFQDRFRLERDESQDGYGIGLSLCQRIIRAHYGQIWVDSVLSEGSCFHFTLPVFHNAPGVPV